MPFWCGVWTTGGAGSWWIFPLLGLAIMAVMAFACSRVSGCMGGRAGRGRDDVAQLRRDLQELKEDVRKIVQNPS